MANEDLGKLQRELPPMPTVAISATVLVGGFMLFNLVALFQGVSDPEHLGAMCAKLLPAILIMAGLLRGHALAWQWGRIAPILMLIGLVAALGQSGPNPILLTMVVGLVAIPVLLSFNAAKEFYGVKCPRCASYRVAAASFFFTQRRCKSCGVGWSY